MKKIFVLSLLEFIALCACSLTSDRDLHQAQSAAISSLQKSAQLQSKELESKVKTFEERLDSLETRDSEWEKQRLAASEKRIFSRVDELMETLNNSFSSTASRPVFASLPPKLVSIKKRLRMIEPTIQLSGTETAGSGVIVYVRPKEQSFEIYALTCYHVIRNIISEGGDPASLKTTVYENERALELKSALLTQREESDLALIRFNYTHPLMPVRWFSRERLDELVPFTSIYIVGCPLGNEPIPTNGEIASLRTRVGGNDYWMVNAPAYYGNSGGGVFSAHTYELIGIYSKIYTHDRGQPTVITHMGLVTPFLKIWDFLEQSAYSFILGQAEEKLTSQPG